ncbi:hypothetical protein R5R35_003557 [Gryllus longicercus]|uniref:Accessory gland protein n=1 Tax=Gryllus longicercus TaxID=2509291 RepID=A0AAN9VKK7_9ORTH
MKAVFCTSIICASLVALIVLLPYSSCAPQDDDEGSYNHPKGREADFSDNSPEVSSFLLEPKDKLFKFPWPEDFNPSCAAENLRLQSLIEELLQQINDREVDIHK